MRIFLCPQPPPTPTEMTVMGLVWHEFIPITTVTSVKPRNEKVLNSLRIQFDCLNWPEGHRMTRVMFRTSESGSSPA